MTTAARAGGRVARGRLPLLGLGFAFLLAGLEGGLARAGLLPGATGPTALAHGPIMVLGFLGTLIALERTVALARPWAYVAPVTCAAGALALIVVPSARIGAGLLATAGAALVAEYALLARRQLTAHVVVMGVGALGWLGAALLQTAGADVVALVPWLTGFLVLTVVGERLELSRLARPSLASRAALLAAVTLFGAGVALCLLALDLGARVAGLGLLGMAAWLLRYDVARGTVRLEGLPQYVAVCLLTGYLWLGLGGLMWLGLGLTGDAAAYDASLHAIFLGFVLSMVFGHAPVIVPAVLGVRLPFRPWLYAPVVLLHASVAVRVIGDLTRSSLLWHWGLGLGVLAVLAFVAASAASVAIGRRR